MGLAYPLFRYLVLPFYFSRIEISGQEHLLKEGAVILAPTHRSRWDPLLVSYGAGRLVTGARSAVYGDPLMKCRVCRDWFFKSG